MTPTIDVQHLTVDYGDGPAIDDMSFELSADRIYGLLGRNGSGKTTLLSVLAAFRKQNAGRVLIGGREPFEDEAVTTDICLIRESGDVYPTTRATEALKMASELRPHWDQSLADRLVERFEIPTRKRVSALSRGKKSALGVTVGMASRAPLTMFDESYLGMDAPSRYAFYEELLADYAAQPRTFIISSHLIEEVGSLFEEILIIDDGRLIFHEDADTMRAEGAAITGPEDKVDRFSSGLTVLGSRSLGRTKSVTVYGGLGDAERSTARAEGLEIGTLPLQDLFVHLTSNTKERS